MSRRRPASTASARARTTRTTVAAVFAGLALVGCSVTNPMLTQLDYNSSDGLDIEVGDVRGINLLVIAEAEGEPGVLVGALTNESSDDTTVGIRLVDAEGSPTDAVEVDLAGGATVSFAGASADGGRVQPEDVEFAEVPAAPGAFIELELRVESGETASRRVPVLDNTLPPYDEVLPGS